MKMKLLALVLVAAWGCGDGCQRKPPETPADTVPPTDSVPADSVDVGDTLPDSLIDTTAVFEEPDEITPEDTVITPEDSAARRSGPRTAAVAGLPVGAYEYPTDMWCKGPLLADAGSVPANILAGLLNKAKYCNFRVAAAIPRRYYTTNGESKGRFSPSRARAAVDEYARVLRNLPADAQSHLAYVIVLDDMNCDECWGGGISQPTTADHTRYARSKFPSWAAVGLRVDPMWMLGISNWGVNVSITQWHERKGPKSLNGVAKQKAWYEQARRAAPKVNVSRLIYSINIGHCAGQESDPCSPSELRTYGSTALNFDASHNCGFISWKYDDFHRTSAYQDAWRYLVNMGKSKPLVKCKA